MKAKTLLLILTAIILTSHSLHAKIITVCGNGCDFSKIQDAIDDINTITGDEVLVYPGTYVENINFNGKAITLKSQSGPDSLGCCQSKRHLFRCRPYCRVSLGEVHQGRNAGNDTGYAK